MECHDSSKENNTIMYCDANNVYGWGISQQPLPYGELNLIV